MRLQLAVTVTVLLALLATFAQTRLTRHFAVSAAAAVVLFGGGHDGDATRNSRLARTKCCAGAAVCAGTRNGARLNRGREPPGGSLCASDGRASGHNKFSIVGFLANGTQLHGRLLRSYKVLGVPEDLLKVVQELEVHGTLARSHRRHRGSQDDFRRPPNKRFSILRGPRS